MPARFLASVVAEPVLARRYRLTAIGGLSLALLLVVMSLAGLWLPSTYARETPSWTEQALAQDWFDLVVAAPALVITAIWSARGSRRGLVAYAGTLLFVVYTAVIYAFAVHLNTLFLVYCAALGVSLYTLAGVSARVWQARAGLQIASNIPHRFTGIYLTAVGVLFGLLWLAQLVPAAIAGRVPAELAATGLLTNPIHVIDLSFILPLHIIAGVAMWRLKTTLMLVAPVLLVFGALMAASIAWLTAYAGNVPVTVAMVVLSLASAILGFLVIRALR